MNNINWINQSFCYVYGNRHEYNSIKDKVLSKIDKNKNNIVFHNFGDLELEIKDCYVCQPRAYKKKTIAMPYNAKHAINLTSSYVNKNGLIYDLSYVGKHDGSYRDNFLNFIIKNFDHRKILIKFRQTYYHTSTLKEKRRYDKDLCYQQSLMDSRLCLCPLGMSGHSQRFYEVMAIGKVPVFFGDKNIRFPLDWIIDWKNIVPMIYFEDLKNRKAVNIIEKWLCKSDKELFSIGKNLKEIYFKHLNDFNHIKKEIEKKIHDFDYQDQEIKEYNTKEDGFIVL